MTGREQNAKLMCVCISVHVLCMCVYKSSAPKKDWPSAKAVILDEQITIVMCRDRLVIEKKILVFFFFFFAFLF